METVYLNHFFLTLDGESYDAIQSSSFLRDQFAPFEQRTTVRQDTTYTGSYFYGAKTYFEFFEAGRGLGRMVGASGVAFGVEAVGASQRLKPQLAEALATSIAVRPITRRAGDRDVDWFYMTVAEDPQPHALNPDWQFHSLIGAHASFTLSDAALEACARLMKETGAGLHIHVAEDRVDVDDARAKYGIGVVERLARLGALNEKTILAHGVHLGKRDIAIARQAGVWFAHNPRSNMNNRVGYAPLAEFGDRVVMGTDGIGADMFDEARFAFFKGRDARLSFGADDWLRVLANNQRLASETFGIEMGTFNEGAAADLAVMDYRQPTPLTHENLAWHFIFGMSSAMIESVMVAGRFLIRNRQAAYPEAALYERARQAAVKLWQKLQRIR